MPFNNRILCYCCLLLPSIFSSIKIFSSELFLCIRWPKYWSFSFSNEYSVLPMNIQGIQISFGIDWFDLLAIQETLKSLLQHHSSKVSVLLCSAFFMVQLSHPYMTTRKTIVLTIWTFVRKVMLDHFVVTDYLAIGAWTYLWFSRNKFFLVPLIYISILVSLPYSFDNCSFVVYCEIRKPDSFSSIFLSQYCFDY